MALITDPDDLVLGTEILLDTAALTFQLVVGGNLSNDGVTGQTLYSFFKDAWKDQSTLIPYPFPAETITPEQFEFIKGWKPKDDTTRNLLRNCGWREIDATNVLNREYMGIVSLGNIDAGDTAYYSFFGDTSKTDFDFAGTVNQGIQTFGDSTNGNFDRRALVLTTYIRTQGKLYGSATTSSIGLSTLNYITNRFPLAEAVDTNITTSDTDISTLALYTGMSITYGSVTRTIGSSTFNFKVVIEGNGGSIEAINEFAQYSLRQGTDIDASSGTETGHLADSLTSFLGTDLKTSTGVYIDNFLSDDTNRIIFTDNGGTERAFPFVASGNLLPNANLVTDTDSIYRMFFADTYGTVNATLVNNFAGTAISGTFGGLTSIGFDFDYDGNTQQSRTAGTDADVVIVAIGLESAQYVSATATIGRAAGQNISLVAPLERNYSDPA